MATSSQGGNNAASRAKNATETVKKATAQGAALSALAKKIVSFIIAGLVGLILGIVGTLVAINHNPEDGPKVVSPSLVFSRIVSENEMVSVAQDYTLTDKATNVNKLFNSIDLPFTKSSFWYRYVGTLKAGVNLKDAKFSENGNVVTITLQQPYIISNTPNMEESGVLEENNNILNPIQVSDVDQFQRECVEMSEKKAVEGGLLEEAKTEAAKNIKDMFNAALGDAYTVKVAWADAKK